MVATFYYVFIPNINFKVIVKKLAHKIEIITKITVVFGRLSKFKNGPKIVSINPITLETKNLGKRNTFSQKSGIFKIHFLYFRIHFIVEKRKFLKYYELKSFNSEYIPIILLKMYKSLKF